MKLRLVLFTGSRHWTTERSVLDALDTEIAIALSQKECLVVLHGGAPGLDTIIDGLCRDSGIHCARVDARWDRLGKGAGPIRNGVMVAFRPIRMYAFHPYLDQSKGTRDCVARAEAAGIEVLRVER